MSRYVVSARSKTDAENKFFINFDSLSEFAEYIVKHPNISFPYLGIELTKSERRILRSKLYAIS